jgi:hypothetical protein
MNAPEQLELFTIERVHQPGHGGRLAHRDALVAAYAGTAPGGSGAVRLLRALVKGGLSEPALRPGAALAILADEEPLSAAEAAAAEGEAP